ncbi:MAG: pilus assembly FimT family protein, partial [Enterovibrio sp.]
IKQRGVTLLEAILAAAILGWVMAYAGTQLMRYAEMKVLDSTAKTMIEDLKWARDFLEMQKYPLTQPNPTGKTHQVGLFYRHSVTYKFDDPVLGPHDRYYINDQLIPMKSKNCPEGGDLSPYIENGLNIANCGDSGFKGLINFTGIYVYLKKYNNLATPDIISSPFFFDTYYLANNVNDFDDTLSIATRLSKIKRDDGFEIFDKNIYLTIYDKNTLGYVPDTTTWISLEDVLSNDLTVLQTFKTRVDNSAKRFGILIRTRLNESSIYLKRDGSITMEQDKSLCWSTENNNLMPCISSFSSTDKPELVNSIVVDAPNFLYGKDVKRSPPIVAYHTFSNGKPIKIPFLKCPFDKTGKIKTVEKIVAIPSSFSTGSENASNFSDPSNIISKGTKGANGKHAFTAGLSLEWTEHTDKSEWVVEGAVAIDSAYSEANNNSSVIRNPNSISFITLQWCEG